MIKSKLKCDEDKSLKHISFNEFLLFLNQNSNKTVDNFKLSTESPNFHNVITSSHNFLSNVKSKSVFADQTSVCDLEIADVSLKNNDSDLINDNKKNMSSCNLLLSNSLINENSTNFYDSNVDMCIGLIDTFDKTLNSSLNLSQVSKLNF